MDAASYLQFILALIFVVGLILAVAWVLKRFGVGQGGVGPLGRKRRLRTIETASIDARHRLVLVRRDTVEHLVLLGPTSGQVIETGIAAPPEDGAEPQPLGFQFKTLLNAGTATTKDPAS
jgi:flagellar protein FliO/FliZ